MRTSSIKSLARAILVSFCALLPACVAVDPVPVSVPDPDSDPDEEPPPPPPPAPLACEGTYGIDTVLDVQAAAVLPQTAYDAIEILRGLRDAPGQTLFDLAEEAGVPAVGEIRDALPSSLESRLYGWIDDELAQFTHGDHPIAVALGLILRVAEATVAEIHLGAELTLDGDAAVHTLREVGFAIEGREVRIGVEEWAGVLDLDGEATARVTPDGTDARLALGAHAFGLPYGELALRAIEDVLVLELGADLRGALGMLIDCPTLAHEVATTCYWGACVGHEAQLLEVCEGGLDHAAAQIRSRLAAVRFDAIALDAGTARLLDGSPADRVADDLVDGVWQATIDAGMGPRFAPGTFAGVLLR